MKWKKGPLPLSFEGWCWIQHRDENYGEPFIYFAPPATVGGVKMFRMPADVWCPVPLPSRDETGEWGIEDGKVIEELVRQLGFADREIDDLKRRVAILERESCEPPMLKAFNRIKRKEGE